MVNTIWKGLKAFVRAVPQLAELKHVNAWYYRNLGGRKGFWLIVLGILLSQLALMSMGDVLDSRQSRKYVTGFSHTFAKKFFYYYYYTGQYPVVNRSEPEAYSRAGAMSYAREHGDSLGTEYQWWYRLGEHARIWAYMPGAWLKGSARDPGVNTFSGLLFILSLLAVFIVFHHYKQPVMGLLIVIMLGSSPFFMAEVYRNDNLFALPGTLSLALLAAHLPLLKGFRKWPYLLLLPLLSGVAVSLAYNMRNEALALLPSAIILLLMAKRVKFPMKIALSILMVGTYYSSNMLLKKHFESKLEEAQDFVDKHGGNVYTGPIDKGHNLWPSIYLGFGDFGKDRGYLWADSVAYVYGIPELNRRLGTSYTIHFSRPIRLYQYYDEDGWYVVKPECIEEFNQLFKEKIIEIARDEPVWLSKILLFRILRVFYDASPLSTGTWFIYIPLGFLGLLFFPFTWLAIRHRLWFHFTLVLFSMPLLASSVIVYSGGNSTYTSPWNLIMYAIIIGWAIEYRMRAKATDEDQKPKSE